METTTLKQASPPADKTRVGPIVNVLFGGGVGVAIVLTFWQLASFADDLYQQGRDESRRPLGR